MADIPSTGTDAAQFSTDAPSIAGDGTADDGLLDGLMPSVSRRQVVLLVVAAVVVGILLWRLREADSDGLDAPEGATDEEVAAEIEQALGEDLEIEDRDGDGQVEIEVPMAPGDELEKDAAVLDGLKQSGKFKGADE